MGYFRLLLIKKLNMKLRVSSGGCNSLFLCAWPSEFCLLTTLSLMLLLSLILYWHLKYLFAEYLSTDAIFNKITDDDVLDMDKERIELALEQLGCQTISSGLDETYSIGNRALFVVPFLCCCQMSFINLEVFLFSSSLHTFSLFLTLQIWRA